MRAARYHRRRWRRTVGLAVAGGALVVTGVGVGWATSGRGGPEARRTPAVHAAGTVRAGPAVQGGAAGRPSAAAPGGEAGAPYGVGVRTVTYEDQSRLVYPPHSGGPFPGPRTLLTYVRYPTAHAMTTEVAGALPDWGAGPFPLVLFSPGYLETPQPYAPLLDAWVRAGYVVAAPVFPLTNPDAPGGPDEADLVNQPGDISFLLTELLAESARPGDVLHRLIDPRHVAVAGQSDGASTALAAAYDSCCRDSRFAAALVLAGDEVSIPGRYYSAEGPPLLAAQGTDDSVNQPGYTTQLFDDDPGTKYLLTLVGGSHLGPFTDDPRYEPVVARVSTDFLDGYLYGDAAALARMASDAAGPLAQLTA